jgi:hypothetical protein
MFCIAVSADVCYEPYRLLYQCSTYPPFITAPLPLQNLEEIFGDSMSDKKIEEFDTKFASGHSLTPGGRGQEFLSMAKGSLQIRFGASLAAPTTAYRNLEVYRAHGLFDVKVSHGTQDRWTW